MESMNESNSTISKFLQSSWGTNLAVGLAITLVIGGIVTTWVLVDKPDFKVLITNYSDRDGGEVISALQKMNVPYQYAENGSAILVPADRVHDVKLKLATQGLPKTAGTGFELMENQKMGTSQFLEQINFQRALEGELARSINSIASIETSRVHLAIPKPSVFVRVLQKPTASVILSLHPNRKLDQQQVNGILHLVSSSIPELLTENVTIIDQNGNLLNKVDHQSAENMLDQTQLKYVDELQKGIVRRIESILIPILGQENIRAEATADVDFSHSEQAAETYTPNDTPKNAAKRSEHSKSSSSDDNSKVGGVPGAYSNQPGQQNQANQLSQLNQLPILNPAIPIVTNSGQSNDEHETTTNYEVDKTVRFIKHSTGTISRLTVAVVINNKTEFDSHGNPVSIALNADDKLQMTNLVKQAMGYKEERGDALSVANIAFKNTVSEQIAPPVYWHQFITIENAKTAAQYLLGLSIIAYLFSILKPLVKLVLTNKKATNQPIDLNQPEVNGQFTNIEATRKMAAENPQIAASVIKNWVNK